MRSQVIKHDGKMSMRELNDLAADFEAVQEEQAGCLVGNQLKTIMSWCGRREKVFMYCADSSGDDNFSFNNPVFSPSKQYFGIFIFE